MRFFLNLFGGFLSLSIVGDLLKKLGFSRVGVATSGCLSTLSGSNLSWLVTDVGFEDGAKLDTPMVAAVGVRPGEDGDTLGYWRGAPGARV